ncbi:MAG: nucleolar RNA-binding Nop10p family protein [Candidatus Aenigmarchaeota archaeon]|nr:nucleolar RNA-binding Nop10p family protein [Candidatus Aenigmarchaeota archaeon]
MRHIYICEKCNIYTMGENCPKCRKKTILKKPPKYSPEDKYGEYRRKMKKLLEAKTKGDD